MIAIINRRTAAGLAGSSIALIVGCANDGPSAPSADGGADGEAGVALLPIDPTLNQDPPDLDRASGDPALDVGGSQLYFDGGAPWVRVAFYGAWPPARSFSVWGCSVLLGIENAPVASYTRQGDAGEESELVDGIDAAKVTYVAEANGFRVRFADPSIVFDRYAIQCNLQRTVDAPAVEDASGAFLVTPKIDKPFG